MQTKLYYSDERNVQIVVALLKAHGIRKIIISPGATNLAFVASVQYDSWFRLYSADDERHAAYMACGMAVESGEPVALSCTGATAGRNYLPAMTEAFYRKIPILAITSSQVVSHAGQLISQFADRRVLPNDAARLSVQLPPVYTEPQAQDCALAVNRALLELVRHGGGPVHLNLETIYAGTFCTKVLPAVRKVNRYFIDSVQWPKLDAHVRIAVWVGSHKPFTDREKKALEAFVRTYDCVVMCDATSSYDGLNKVVTALVASQNGLRQNPKRADLHPQLVIHIGEVSNDYATQSYLKGLAPVWRVNEDGELRDRFGRLQNVFEMPEAMFFEHYANACAPACANALYNSWLSADRMLRNKIPEMAFSNLWIARELLPHLPVSGVLHLGLSTSLQMWTSQLQGIGIKTVSNVGCCGIDGVLSSAIGASLAAPSTLVFCVLGDLSFFYDINSLGNRHIGGNLRILLINNACGGMFHSPTITTSKLGDDLNEFAAAGRHFGNKSRGLAKHFATDLGFKYLSAESKDEFRNVMLEFQNEKVEKPMLLECFTEADDDGFGFRIKESLDPYEPAKTIASGVKALVPGRVKAAIRELTR